MCFQLKAFGLWMPCKSELGVGGCCQEMFVWATCPLQFAKAGSAAKLLPQEKNNTAYVQRNRVHITGFICTVETGADY
jgi:CRISPR/Cas system CMR subunit Cmr4 (Cas7 group RAMP superfamily)